MEDISCDICFINFDDKEHVPKFLECGHTFCLTCIQEINIQRKCPNCNKEFRIRDIDAYPTNYSLLKTIDAYNSFASSSWNIKNQIEKLKASLISAQGYLRDYATIFNEVTKAISTLESLNVRNYNDLEIIETLQSYKNCQKVLNSAENFAKTINRKNFLVKISLKDSNSTTEYINELVTQMNIGSIIYAVQEVGYEYKFGVLSSDPLFPGMFFMHSLSNLTTVKDAHCIWFSDLKKCFIKKKPFISFIEMPSCSVGTEKILMRMNDTALSSQFLKLCSGETGALYKGAKYGPGFGNYCIHPCFSVTEYIVNNNAESNPVDYDLGLSFPSMTYKAGAVIVEGFIDGGFKVFKVIKDSKHEDIIGKVLNPDDIGNIGGSNSKIVDSGIVYTLE